MDKYFGVIGFANEMETKPGVWEECIAEREYFGDVLRNYRRLDGSSDINDNISVNNEISVVGDPFAYENFHSMRYLTFMGSKWKITSVEVVYPRLKLSIGGLYNDGLGKEPDWPE